MEPIQTTIGGFGMTELPATATPPRVTMIFHKSLNPQSSSQISPVPATITNGGA
jgi:hypothetical protein